MITKLFWEIIEVGSYVSYLWVVIGSIFTIAIDIFMLPFEIIAFLLHWLLEGDWRE